MKSKTFLKNGSPDVNDVTWSITSGSEFARLEGSVLIGVGAGEVTVKGTTSEGSATKTITVIASTVQYMSIAEAKKQETGKFVTFRGVVVAVDGSSAYIADDTGYAYVYNWRVISTDSAIKNYSWTLGDTVEIKAKVAEYNNNIQFTNSEKVGDDTKRLDGTYAVKIEIEITPVSPVALTKDNYNNLSANTMYTFTGELVSYEEKEKTSGQNKFPYYTTTWKVDGIEDDIILQTSTYDDPLYDVESLSFGYSYKVTTPYDGSKFLLLNNGTTLDEIIGVKITSTDDSVVKGQKLQMKAETNDDAGVTWTSSDETKATVSADGLVTGVAAGQATITATSKTDPTKFASVTINVTNDVVEVTSVSLNKTELTLEERASEKLIATITPENATDKSVTWSVTAGQDKVTVAQDGTVTALAVGEATVTVTTTNGKTVSCKVTVTAKDYSIKQITKENTVYTVRGEVVAKNTQALVISDGTDSVYLYDRDLPKNYNIGDYVEATGSVTSYNKALQMAFNATTPVEVTKLDGKSPYTIPEPTQLTAEIANSWKTTKSFKTSDIKEYTWTAVAGKSGNFTTLNIEGADLDIEPVYLDTTTYQIETGTAYKVTAYFIGYFNYANMVITDIEEDTSPSVTITNGESASVGEGETLQLEATLKNTTGNVTWTSANSEIASVNNEGLVTGVKAGKTTITASVGEVKDTIEITITPKVTSLTISAAKSELKINESTTLSATLAPEGAVGEVTYEVTSGESYVTLEGNKVTGKAIGSATIVGKVGTIISAPITITVTNETLQQGTISYDYTSGWDGITLSGNEVFNQNNQSTTNVLTALNKGTTSESIISSVTTATSISTDKAASGVKLATTSKAGVLAFTTNKVITKLEITIVGWSGDSVDFTISNGGEISKQFTDESGKGTLADKQTYAIEFSTPTTTIKIETGANRHRLAIVGMNFTYNL